MSKREASVGPWKWIALACAAVLIVFIVDVLTLQGDTDAPEALMPSPGAGSRGAG